MGGWDWGGAGGETGLGSAGACLVFAREEPDERALGSPETPSGFDVRKTLAQLHDEWVEGIHPAEAVQVGSRGVREDAGVATVVLRPSGRVQGVDQVEERLRLRVRVQSLSLARRRKEELDLRPLIRQRLQAAGQERVDPFLRVKVQPLFLRGFREQGQLIVRDFQCFEPALQCRCHC